MGPATALLLNKAKEATKHAILRTISVVAVLGVITFLGWAVYVTAIKPHVKPTPTTTENANKIYHITVQVPAKRVFALGATAWNMDIGIVKYDWNSVTATIIKEVIKETDKLDAQSSNK